MQMTFMTRYYKISNSQILMTHIQMNKERNQLPHSFRALLWASWFHYPAIWTCAPGIWLFISWKMKTYQKVAAHFMEVTKCSAAVWHKERLQTLWLLLLIRCGRKALTGWRPRFLNVYSLLKVHRTSMTGFIKLDWKLNIDERGTPMQICLT